MQSFEDYADDCQDESGTRCISRAEGEDPICLPGMTCSEDGQVLVDGAICSRACALSPELNSRAQLDCALEAIRQWIDVCLDQLLSINIVRLT